MAPRSTSTRRRATSPSAASPSPSSTGSSPVTPATPNLEADTPSPQDLDAPASSPELAAAAIEGLPVELGLAPTRAGNTHAQLVALVNAVDAYTSRGGSWDDVLYAAELAKTLLGQAGG